MKIRHSPHHWIAVAVVLAVLLLTLSRPMARAAARPPLEGRPAMPPQAGQGAMAGPPQGGIAVENSTDMQPRAQTAARPRSAHGLGDFDA